MYAVCLFISFLAICFSFGIVKIKRGFTIEARRAQGKEVFIRDSQKHDSNKLHPKKPPLLHKGGDAARRGFRSASCSDKRYNVSPRRHKGAERKKITPLVKRGYDEFWFIIVS